MTPYLSVDGAARALEFYEKAFGAKEIRKARRQMTDAKIIHSRLMIGNSLIMMSDGFGDASATDGSGITLHVYSKNVDKLWRDALAAGAKVSMPLDDMYWGERYGQLIDPFGKRWSVSMRVKMSKEEMQSKQEAAMAMFADEKHPEKQS